MRACDNARENEIATVRPIAQSIGAMAFIPKRVSAYLCPSHHYLLELTLICLQAGENRMISLCTRRRFGCWLLGLFLIAQLTGVVPLLTIHLEHEIASAQDAAADFGSAGAVSHAHHHHVHHGSGPHDHGASDPNDQCCTLHHHLTGVLPHAVSAGAVALVVAAIVSLPPAPVAAADPGQLERPPKFLSV
jgi:hypothetical protein